MEKSFIQYVNALESAKDLPAMNKVYHLYKTDNEKRLYIVNAIAFITDKTCQEVEDLLS